MGSVTGVLVTGGALARANLTLLLALVSLTATAAGKKQAATSSDRQPSLNMFVSRVFFNDITVRLESNNTLDQSRCRERRRYDGTTIDGNISEIEDSCSSRYRRLTLRVQTTF